jgi:hypothetical protein
MKILFGCETSGYPSEEFASRGHEVYSCDLLPGKNVLRRTHIQGDFLKTLYSEAWDAVIAFPPCTYICRGSMAHINSPGRRQSALHAIDFVKEIFLSPVPLIAVENPIGLLNKNWCKASQIIYPWQFGDPYTKDICLWLRGLPKIVPRFSTPQDIKLKTVSNHVNGRMSQALKSEIKSSWKHYPLLVKTMADQWSEFLNSQNPRPKLL